MIEGFVVIGMCFLVPGVLFCQGDPDGIGALGALMSVIGFLILFLSGIAKGISMIIGG